VSPFRFSAKLTIPIKGGNGMSDNITTITHVLQKEFPNRAVEHRFAKTLHAFRLDGEAATFGLNEYGYQI